MIMSQSITSSIIGSLQQDSTFDDWWRSVPTPIPFFDNQPLEILFMDLDPTVDINFIAKADTALSHFMQLTNQDRFAITELAFQNCMDFLDAVEYDEADEPLHQIKDKNDIWDFIYPSEIYISLRHKNQEMYVQIACNCEWEQEHGLLLVFKQGKKLTRISPQDGHLTEGDAYGKPDSEDELLRQFNL